MMDTEEEFREKMADAVYLDLNELDRLRPDAIGGYHFPYGGEVYRVACGETWSVQWMSATERMDEGGLVVTGRPTLKDAIRDAVKALHGTKCKAGYVIGQDSCPHCDAETERFENNYGR
jgi:hypothetical protein